MRHVSPPQISALFAYDACVGEVSDTFLRQRYLDVRADIGNAEASYETNARAATLYREPQHEGVGSAPTTLPLVAMKTLYETYMVGKQKGGGRKIYNQLITSARDNVCLLCGFGQVTQLDHLLPKTRYPAFAVTPINLVPACGDCNYFKRTVCPTGSGEQFLHPYYDNVSTERWLHARVEETPHGPLVQFSVIAPSSWPTNVATRIEHHFSKLQLRRRFRTQAQSELSLIRENLVRLHARTGGQGVQQWLLECAEGRASAYLNAWQTAAYFAMAQSQWFCSGGFALIPPVRQVS